MFKDFLSDKCISLVKIYYDWCTWYWQVLLIFIHLYTNIVKIYLSDFENLFFEKNTKILNST